MALREEEYRCADDAPNLPSLGAAAEGADDRATVASDVPALQAYLHSDRSASCISGESPPAWLAIVDSWTGIISEMRVRYNYVCAPTIDELIQAVGEWQETQGGGRIVSVLRDDVGSPSGARPAGSYVAIVEEEI